jgi:hypothetical protein
MNSRIVRSIALVVVGVAVAGASAIPPLARANESRDRVAPPVLSAYMAKVKPEAVNANLYAHQAVSAIRHLNYPKIGQAGEKLILTAARLEKIRHPLDSPSLTAASYAEFGFKGGRSHERSLTTKRESTRSAQRTRRLRRSTPLRHCWSTGGKKSWRSAVRPGYRCHCG